MKARGKIKGLGEKEGFLSEKCEDAGDSLLWARWRGTQKSQTGEIPFEIFAFFVFEKELSGGYRRKFHGLE